MIVAVTPSGMGQAPQGAGLRVAMRRLWTDHVVWTRQVIVSALAGLPDLEPALARLLRNQDEIGAALGSVYGPMAGAAAARLLREHIMISVQLVTAMKAGDAAGAARWRAEWSRNAAEIARALAALGIGPEEELRQMLEEHLELTAAEAQERLRGDWQGDVATFDRVLSQAWAMSDALVDGILAQRRAA